MKYLFVMIGFIFCLDNSLNQDLLNSLKINSGWEKLKKIENGTVIKTKKIKNMELSAIMVEREININPDRVQEILVDILNYNRVLKSSGSLKTTLFKKDENVLDGYQYIESGVPLINDRKYCFRMNFSKLINGNNTLMEWYLLNKNSEYKDFIDSNDKKAVYLDYGAGTWMIESVDNGSYIFTYRLFMDPGGSMPNFIVEKINEYSIYNIFNDVIIEAKSN